MADTVNAQIRRVRLGYEGHGALTAMVEFQWGSFIQSFPHYILNGPFCALFVKGMIDAVGVQDWEDLQGRYVRLQLDGNRPPLAVGHIVEDRWFNPKQACDALIAKEAARG